MVQHESDTQNVIDNDWAFDGWWRVIRNGTVWNETVSKGAAFQSADHPGDIVQQHFQRREEKWETVSVAA